MIVSADASATVVIITRNRKDLLLNALASCQAQTALLEVLVTDDASSDGTYETVQSAYPSVALRRNATPQGYIVGRNAAAGFATAPFIFSLDDDAVFDHPETVERALCGFEHPAVGAISLPVKNVLSGTWSTRRPPTPDGCWVAYTFVGTAHALRRDLFLRLGGYESAFFHQGEEIDYALRMLNAGHVVRVMDTPPIQHFESPIRDLTRMDVYGRRNDILIGWRNAPAVSLPAYWLRAFVKGSVVGLRVRRPWNMARGFKEGFTACSKVERRPLGRCVWRLAARLRSRGPLPFEEIASSLPLPENT